MQLLRLTTNSDQQMFKILPGVQIRTCDLNRDDEHDADIPELVFVPAFLILLKHY